VLELRDLGDAGRAYVRDRLAGGKSLSQLLLQDVDLQRGTVWTYLPSVLTAAQAYMFDAGWDTTQFHTEFPLEQVDAWTSIEDLVSRFLHEEERAVAIWEDAVMHADFPWIQHHPEEPLVFLENEVYYVLDEQAATEGAIGRALSGVMTAWWGSPGILATPPAEAVVPLLQRRATISCDQLQPVVEALQLLFFQAYDAEGFVFWLPNDSALRLNAAQ
jgi:hypothetical protein